ncbi:39S ribosomal protein L42, mitochondrial [Xenopus laevis]|uniref:Large ribosomal subunit protein mL42 n=2 Tax=Xenopus laevis TaxID=8355 RepID=A0A1L8GUR3_XENLA|nr:39S ribosomal protein L42, mitochondrial [Xenopus laevis]OCT87536.1 hypothetical protein XELAEV_18021231mg [Xenopus laevis]
MAAALVTAGRLRTLSCAALRSGLSAVCRFRHKEPIADGITNPLRYKSTYSALPDDYNCKVELALTSDGKTIVCYHPSVEVPYEHTKPLPQKDPLTSHTETHELVLKARLNDVKAKPEPTIEELSKMFYTTKHRWYPVGQYHRRRMKQEHPKDR